MLAARSMVAACSAHPVPNHMIYICRNCAFIKVFGRLSVSAFCKQTDRGKSGDSKFLKSSSAANSSYMTLASRVSKELEVKRSKFIAMAAPVDDENNAFTFLSEVSDPRATHNCWAYKIRDRYRFSDDGEPGGTAGRPIYTAIESSDLDAVMVVVTRYFGGTKLGTGGLIRAYGGVAAECLKDAPTRTVKAKLTMLVRVRFDLLGVLYPLLELYNVQKQEEYYEDANGGGLQMQLVVDVDKADEFESSLSNACRGSAAISRIEA